ncbi:hypothetical protein [Vibrio alfacsensis]|uniref:hypothetical protein n=2 Tax=Vibrio TaxID=662 RepID=UPI00078E38F8|nr:hypothetical protein [Vibrio alfacsensis]BAU71075.1 hypothetical protein [Vibrio sp. 04Ya108]BBM67663.1 hypothetical protein VA249_43090 [Vibrio alfacsensis]BCN27161.1 hypothetical protein VYA_43530 [Vibrio alfacsensis]
MYQTKKDFCEENFRRFFNRNYCLHIQTCTKKSGDVLTLRFQIAPILNGKVVFTGTSIFQLSSKELTQLCRFLLLRTATQLEFPFHNGKTLKLEANPETGLNVQIIEKGKVASFMVPNDELFSVTGIALSTLARREMLDSITTMTMIKNGL